MNRTLKLVFFVLVVWLVSACTPEGGKGAPPGPSAAAGPNASSVAKAPAKAAATVGAQAPATVGAQAEGVASAPEKIRPLAPGAPLKIGVTLHPYYSWTKNIAGDARDVEVRAILPGDVDAGSYQPRPEDIQKLADLDAVVVNGIGHDDFIADMIKASGNTRLVVIRANDATPLLRAMHGGSVNSHTFISFTNAVQQTYAIERVLAALRPDLAGAFEKNAGEYAKRLRQIKAGAAAKLANAKVHRVVTVHDGYSYLCQEFGVDVAGVVEPSHGLVPSATELGAMVDLLKREKITVILSEESFPEKMLEVLESAGKPRVYIISHVAAGEYGAGEFEAVMQKNADTLVQALVTDG